MSENGRGQLVWNKGLTKATDARVVQGSRKMSLTRKEKHFPSWCKGLTKETDERVRKISKALRGEKGPRWKGGKEEVKCEWCGQIRKVPKWALKKHSMHFCDRVCRSKWQVGHNVGVKSSNWKGGITPLHNRIRGSFKYRQWRSDVFTRDDFTCQECGRRGGALRAHHGPKSFAFISELNDIRTFEQAMDCEELWNINNGITYCTKCHGIKEKELRELKSVF